MVKVLLPALAAWCPSSPPVPPQRAPGGSGRLGAPRVRPRPWAPRHRLGGSSEPPPKDVGRFPLPSTLWVVGCRQPARYIRLQALLDRLQALLDHKRLQVWVVDDPLEPGSL